MIICNRCSEAKDITEYRKPSINKCGTKGICRECKNKQDKEYWGQKSQDEEFKVKHSKRQVRYKQHKTEYQKRYDAENKDKKLEYTKKYYKENPSAKAIQLVRTRIWHVLKSQHKNKEQSTLEALGCSAEDYKLYLAEQFDSKMTWGNHGVYWEIDHIVPLNQGGSFHYTNTRPLEKTLNRTRKKK